MTSIKLISIKTANHEEFTHKTVLEWILMLNEWFYV